MSALPLAKSSSCHQRFQTQATATVNFPNNWRTGLTKTAPPIYPDFVIELRSASDNLSGLQAKMQEYIDNGAVLGWLIERQNRTVYIYRPNQALEILGQPEVVNGDPELPRFCLQMAKIW